MCCVISRDCRSVLLLVLAVLAAFVPAAYAIGRDRGKAEAVQQPAVSLQAKLESLTLRQRVAQLMVVTLQGANGPDAADVEFLSLYQPGGVIIPKMLKPGMAVTYVEALQSVPSPGAGIPFLIGTDLGMLPRYGAGLKEFFAQFPSLLAIAAADDPGTTERYAALMADCLEAMGFSFLLGPSLILAPTLPSAKGTVNCLGSDPSTAADVAGGLVRSFDQAGIVAMPMGFPGGGADRLGRRAPMLITPASRLLDRDLLPFRRAVEGGAGIIHVGNTLVPTVDAPNKRACLSSVVMGDLLRRELRFEGVVVAGPLDAVAPEQAGGAPEAAVMAIQAGADMILWNRVGARVVMAVEQIVAAVERGEISATVIDAAVRRVLGLKERYDLANRGLPDAKAIRKKEKSNYYFEEAYQVERRTVTLVLNRGNMLPLRFPESTPVGVIGTFGFQELQSALAQHLKYVGVQPIVSSRHSRHILSFEFERIMKRADEWKTVVCVLSDQEEVRGQIELVRRLKEKGVKVVVVLVGYPHALGDLLDADAVVLAYGRGEAWAESMRAVADVLAGKAPLRMKTDIADIRTQVGEEETFSVQDLVESPVGRLPVTLEPPFVAGLGLPYDPSLAIKRVEWNFGDGKKAKGLVVNHAYRKAGRYPVTFTITEDLGEKMTGVLHVVVE